jgi:magnesium chelatase family protein
VDVSPAGEGDARGERSEIVRERVERARAIQADRAQRIGARSPSEMPAGRALEWARVEKGAVDLLRSARERLALSERAAERIVRVARTIADLEERETVDVAAIAEAISFRARQFGDRTERHERGETGDARRLGLGPGGIPVVLS